MKTVVYPGSFDPVTNGHAEIIRSAARLFDEVVVLVASNVAKTCLFSAAERVAMLQSCLHNVPNVRVEAFGGLVAKFAEEAGAVAIVKGLRAMSDFDAEFQQALTNRRLSPKIETVLIPASGTSMFLSSSMVRQVCSLGGDISGFVPPEALAAIRQKITQHAQKESESHGR